MKTQWTQGNDVNDQPTSIVKLLHAREYAQLLLNFVVKHTSDFSIIDVMNMQSFMDKLNKKSNSNINKHHQKAVDTSFFFFGDRRPISQRQSTRGS
jgi:hypothetical protein